MKDFIYEGTVPVIYGTGQSTTVIDKLKEFCSRILIVPAPSFIKSGHFDTLHQTLLDVGMTVFCLDNIKGPMPSQYINTTPETLADIIEDAITGNLA